MQKKIYGELKIFSGTAHPGFGNKICDYLNIKLGKAGKKRHIGRRPEVRGVAMAPNAHPHGGGEGKTSGGRPSVTPWGFITIGKKTRSKRKYTNRLIIKKN